MGTRGCPRGSKMGWFRGPFGPSDTPNTIPLHARARTMICQKCRFIKNGIKTASSRGIRGPQNGPHFGALKMTRMYGDTVYPSISVYSRMYRCTLGYTPPKWVPHFGSFKMAHLIQGSSPDLIWFWVVKTADGGPDMA